MFSEFFLRRYSSAALQLAGGNANSCAIRYDVAVSNVQPWSGRRVWVHRLESSRVTRPLFPADRATRTIRQSIEAEFLQHADLSSNLLVNGADQRSGERW